MARPVKIGIDYFSLDVDFDAALEMVLSKYGEKGLGIIIRIWQYVFKTNYYIPYNEDQLLMIKRNCSDASYQEIDEIINMMVDKDLFDKRIFLEYGLLTSKRIQQNYKEAKSKSKYFEIDEELILINTELTSINSQNNGIKVPKGKESKLNKNIQKEKKEEIESKDSLLVETNELAPVESFDFVKIVNYFNLKSKLKPVKKLTDKRKAHLHSRIKEYSYDEMFLVIDNISLSPFMRGENNKQWMATFDWVFGHPNNFIKVLEGNYINQQDPIINSHLMKRAEQLKKRHGEE